MKKITIVGAGFAGLTLARELLARGFAVEILEKSNRPGGLIGSYRTPAGLVETGATTILRTEQVDRLCQELGVAMLQPSPDSKKRLIYAGKLTRWPLTVSETAVLAVNFLKAKFKKTLKPIGGETVAEWGRRNLGSAVVEKVLGPALQGIYATDGERLSASLVLGPLFAQKKKGPRYRGILSPGQGMFSLIQALEKDVLAKGGVIRYDQNVTAIVKPMVIATSAASAASLARSEDPLLAKRLEGLKLSPVITMTAFYDQPNGTKAFGCVIPRRFGVRTLGVLLNHAIFPGRDSRFGETWILGGAGDASVIDLKDQDLRNLQKKEREILFGKTDDPIDIVITRWPTGLPNYDLVLEDVLTDLSVPKGIWLHGNWLGGIGLSKILERSEHLAEKISQELT